MGKAVFLAGYFKATFGCAFFTLFGHNTHRMGFMAQRNLLHLIRGGHLKVKRHRKRLHQRFDIRVTNVAAIFAQVCGNAVGARLLGDDRSTHRIRHSTTTGIANSRNVINVHPKA